MPTCHVASLVAGMRYNYIVNLSVCILLLQLDVNNSDTAVVINTSAAQLSGVRIMHGGHHQLTTPYNSTQLSLVFSW